jgi:GNAT superfamily N-acetyltransferase
MIRPQIRAAAPADAAEILAMVRELAAFENLSDSVVATQESLSEAMFGAAPSVLCDIAEATGGRPVGYMLCFYTFSSFLGRRGLWIEDIYVRPDWRRQGVGAELMAYAARRCVAESLARLEWSVLDWNDNAIGFYKARGATLLDDWSVCRVAGAELWRLADHAR